MAVRCTLLVLLTAVLLGAACGTGVPAGDGVPEVGASLVVRAERSWPEALRRDLGLERLPVHTDDDDCVPSAAAKAAGDVQGRVLDTRIDEALNGVLGRNWGSAWLDVCRDGHFKVGVPLVARDELRREVARARAVMRERGMEDVTDLVAVVTPRPALSAALDRLFAASAGAPDDLAGALAIQRNAVHVEVARDVGAAGWRSLRRAAVAAGVTVVLERADVDRFGLRFF